MILSAGSIVKICFALLMCKERQTSEQQTAIYQAMWIN